MKIQTGSPVRGDDFFKRNRLIEQAWELIETGNHVLIAAPRRVGKTSLMYYLLDNPRDHYNLIYYITESVNNENEFFRRIINRILKTDFIKRSQKVLTFLKQHKPTITKIGADGVEFGVSEDHDYYEMLSTILRSISKESDKLVVMIDEFPETLENITKDNGETTGRHFLQSNRELRQDAYISQNVRFVYTGSIGLENIVSELNAVNTINDLSRLKIPPLSSDEAKLMIALLMKNVRFELSEKLVEYILQEIEWLIPFYIQLVIEELRNVYRDDGLSEVTKQTIDKAIHGMLEHRNHFEHWHTRLRTTFESRDYNFVKEILNLVSENGHIHSNEIYNLAVKHEKTETYKDYVGSLVYDGYINNHDDPKVYRFNSPILRMWWRQNVAN